MLLLLLHSRTHDTCLPAYLLAVRHFTTQQREPKKSARGLKLFATKALTFNYTYIYTERSRGCNAMKHGMELIKCDAQKKIISTHSHLRTEIDKPTEWVSRFWPKCPEWSSRDGSRNNFRTINTIDNSKTINIYFILIYTRPFVCFLFLLCLFFSVYDKE